MDRHELSLAKHLLELDVPAGHKAHVGINLQVVLFTAPQLLRQVASLAWAGSFLPGYVYLSHLHLTKLHCVLMTH